MRAPIAMINFFCAELLVESSYRMSYKFRDLATSAISPPPPGKTPLLQNPNLSEPIFGKGMRRSTFQRKKGFFSEKGGGNSVNEGFGKDVYRKGNAVKRSGPVAEPPDSEN